MIALPHDASDLMLAPTLLALEANIERLGALSLHDLVIEVGLVSDLPDWTRANREDGLIRTVCAQVDRHDWELTWDPRGLCMSHHGRQIVLAVPPHFVDYLDGVHRVAHTG